MKKKKNCILVAINILIVIISSIICLKRSVFYFNEEDTFMAIGSILMILLPPSIYVLEKIIKKEINEVIKLGFLSFVLTGGVLGAIGDLYNKVVHYDKVVHFISGIMISLFIMYLYKNFYNKKLSKKTIFLIVVISNITIASLWEIFEFLFDILFDKNAQKGNSDTMLDMITAITGGIITFFSYIKMRINKPY